MRRFINFYDEHQCYICGASYYFDQRLSTTTALMREIIRYKKQMRAYYSDKEKYVKPNYKYIKVFAGERFNEQRELTGIINLGIFAI